MLRHRKAAEQAILSRHICGAFMSNSEKATWSRVVTEQCTLCGELDTKAHRLYSCPALAPVRVPHQDTLDLVQRYFPWWTHLLVACEHFRNRFTVWLCNPAACLLSFRFLHARSTCSSSQMEPLDTLLFPRPGRRTGQWLWRSALVFLLPLMPGSLSPSLPG